MNPSYVLQPAPEALNLYSVAEGEKLLRQANEAYHNGDPIMQDGEYDALWRRHLESRRRRPDASDWQDTILDKVGAAPKPTSGFRKAKHTTPMLSLDNVFEAADHTCPGLDEWAQGILARCGAPVEILAEPKIDGLSLALIYSGGSLHQAITRGDGCLDGSSLLEFQDGRRLPIADVVARRVAGAVKCYDTELKAAVWCPVLDYHDNGESEEFIELVAEDDLGNQRALVLTKNHQIFLPGRGYVAATQLTVGDPLLCD